MSPNIPEKFCKRVFSSGSTEIGLISKNPKHFDMLKVIGIRPMAPVLNTGPLEVF